MWPCRVRRILQIFNVALEMMDVVDKKQMCGDVITRTEHASEDWNCIISMVLTSFKVFFGFHYACDMHMCYICYLALSGFSRDKVWLFLWEQVGSPASAHTLPRSPEALPGVVRPLPFATKSKRVGDRDTTENCPDINRASLKQKSSVICLRTNCVCQ